MIVTELWNGQGLGNQLACYVTTKCIALDNGYEYGVHHPERFKGSSFMNPPFGNVVTGGHTEVEGRPPQILPDGIEHYYVEKNTVLENGSNVTDYDPDLFKVKDSTKIDGLMQGENYFINHKEEIREWLKVEPLNVPDDLCIINFRGGEYRNVPDFFLPKSYWDNAIRNMKNMNPNMSFHVVTDDPHTASMFFEGINISHNMEMDYRCIQHAKYLILSNSSFAFFPAWLNENLKFCIAPRYWGRYNISDGYWSLEQNYTRGWYYQDREGNISLEKDL